MKENLNAIVALLGLLLFLVGVGALWGFGVVCVVGGLVLMLVGAWPYLWITVARKRKG